MIQVKPKKYFGQHFLTDLQIAHNIVESLPSDISSVLEIGPGTGVLTQFLINNKDINFSAIEIDAEAIAFLHEKFPNLHLIEGDFLKMDLQKEFGKQQFSIIGNFPYNISSQIFFKVLENRDQIPYVVGMIQKEVAERIAAKHGNKTYGITSVLLQSFYTIEYLLTVNEHVFDPPPKVKSAVIRLSRNNVQKLNCNETLFVRTVKTAFNQRRKTLRNSLKPLLNGLPTPEPIFNLRPEQLSVSDFIFLTNLLEEKLGK